MSAASLTSSMLRCEILKPGLLCTGVQIFAPGAVLSRGNVTLPGMNIRGGARVAEGGLAEYGLSRSAAPEGVTQMLLVPLVCFQSWSRVPMTTGLACRASFVYLVLLHVP